MRPYNIEYLQKITEDIVADDDNYIYVQNDGDIGKQFEIK